MKIVFRQTKMIVFIIYHISEFINIESLLVQVMNWYWAGSKPLYEPMMTC